MEEVFTCGKFVVIEAMPTWIWNLVYGWFLSIYVVFTEPVE